MLHTFAVLPCLMRPTCSTCEPTIHLKFFSAMWNGQQCLRRGLCHIANVMQGVASSSSYCTRQQPRPQRCWSWFSLHPTAWWFQRLGMPNYRQGCQWVRFTNTLPDIPIRLICLWNQVGFGFILVISHLPRKSTRTLSFSPQYWNLFTS